MRFADRVAIVTGGASGIGRATCLRFAKEGARVLVADRNGQAADETAAHIQAEGGTAQGIRTNVAREEDAQKLAARALDSWGRIDVLVNNAASFVKKRVEEATRDDWEEILGVNVMGTSFCTRFAVPAMKRQGGGAIVNLGSIYGAVAAPDFMTYNATKAAIINMTKCMALDLAPFNIRVNCVCPGQTHTPALEAVLAGIGMTIQEGEQRLLDRHMIKRFGRPEEIAPAILFLASDEASFITAATLMVDGGSTG
jgi:NAD(P)-dependent dehydrogenase (short-subunit alcohol dehydrogenase family)